MRYCSPSAPGPVISGLKRHDAFRRWAVYVAIACTAVGPIHLTATDTTTFLAFADTFEAGHGSDLVNLGADLLLRLHAATFVAWVTSYFFALPIALGWAAVVDGSFPAWYPWLAWVAAALAGVSVTLTLAAGQRTTLSEMRHLPPLGNAVPALVPGDDLVDEERISDG